ncbi:hypothetical protein MalM25_33000 [Planctomycetes bacterium MalM25]|nr:hypothetical protein MalM25_33000 [Planctomycetes bacterium MalM25]
MLTELGGKGGDVCRHAREGEIKCPLIVRPTSEDVVTGQVMGVLEALNPRWWIPDLLNAALGEPRFRRQCYRGVRIRLWDRQPAYPRHLAPWAEGQTEVDAVLSWEKPTPTTVFLEWKLHSSLGAKVSNHNGTAHNYPSDQLIRNARVGLWQCGWIDEKRLFDDRRDFVLVLIARKRGEKLVGRYRDPEQLLEGLPNRRLFSRLPPLPFIGELGFLDLARAVTANRNQYGRAERVLVDRLEEYLAMKSQPRLVRNG